MSHPQVALRVADATILIVFMTPLVVLYWNGTYALLDVYMEMENKELSWWISVLIGFLLTPGKYTLGADIVNIGKIFVFIVIGLLFTPAC